MGPHLTYRPREGRVFGNVAGTPVLLMTMRNQSDMNVEAWRQAAGAASSDVRDWPKMQELRSGKASASPLGKRLTVVENAPLDIYEFPGAYAQRFDGVDKGGADSGAASHPRHSRVIWIKMKAKTGFPDDGFCLHGPPACGNPRCIVILQDWDSVFQALKTARQVSFVVES